LPQLIEFEAPVPLQFLASSFFRDRTIPLTQKRGTEQEAASSKTLAISKGGEFTVFVVTGRNAGLATVQPFNAYFLYGAGNRLQDAIYF
jgi:hypothetical protein